MSASQKELKLLVDEAVDKYAESLEKRMTHIIHDNMGKHIIFMKNTRVLIRSLHKRLDKLLSRRS